MKYKAITAGAFLARPNRFIAHIDIGGKTEICHVKNTGRCRELLTPNAKVYCEDCLSPTRKTRYDLIAVEKGEILINMDSQAPNKAAKEWLLKGGLGEITNLKAEAVCGASRFDFSFQKEGKPCFLEVKGVTLEAEGVCAFPDAPTTRGAKHLRELTALKAQDYGAYVLFVIQMKGAKYLKPNDSTDPAFGQALREAAGAGVEIFAYDCIVTPNEMVLDAPVPIKL